jgi:DNA-binding response OmpR family regulator
MNPNSETVTRGKVLVIDDELAILITLQRVLRNAGYDVQTAQSPREGLSLFKKEPFDLVTVDRSMPEMNGEALAAEMKRFAPKVPIILITGFPGAATRPELFHAILGKPFRIPELIQSLTSALQGGGEDTGSETNAPQQSRACLPQQNPPASLDAQGVARLWTPLLPKPYTGSV